MSSSEDPPRLTAAGSEGSALLRDLLRTAQQDAPDAATAAALARRVAALRHGVSPHSGGSSAAASRWAALPLVKGIIVFVAGALVVLGAKWAARAHQMPLLPAPMAASSAEVAPLALEPLSAAVTTEAPVISAMPSVSGAPAARAVAREPAPPGSSILVEDPAADVLLVQRAQDALRRDPQAALALTAEHARRFPRSSLKQEREMITIEAMLRSGQKDRARSRAERFVQQFPGSPHRRRLVTLFGSALEVPPAASSSAAPRLP